MREWCMVGKVKFYGLEKRKKKKKKEEAENANTIDANTDLNTYLMSRKSL